ncbi:MAG: MFS transporter [Ruminococcaceae bacterium]|nr:MFS transporter [Oscillospiraceae bacterium]
MLEDKNSAKLWTKNFTILTLGTVVSMLGNALSGFAIGLLVLDYTGSTFMFALSMVIYNLPKFLVPIVAGPLLDKFSRRKTIYMLDFISGTLYVILAFLMWKEWFSYSVLIFFTLVLGSIDSSYTVAYESLYPNLVSDRNLAKANSITSIIMPLTQVMSLFSAILYNTVGIAPLFLINAFSFYIAAIFETIIKVDEKHIRSDRKLKGIKLYFFDLKEGISYIKEERGLSAITLYFGITMFASSSLSSLMLPFFREYNDFLKFPFESFIFSKGEYTFIAVMAFAVTGRVLGGIVQYRTRYPAEKKYLIALLIYLTICIFDGVILFLPVAAMMILYFLTGALGVTSYNIRITGTQKYVSDDKRARFNGVFLMTNNVGMILGNLTAGTLAEFMPMRAVVALASGVNLIAVFCIIYRKRADIKPIYNIDA